MIYRDQMYGDWEPPKFVERIIKTTEMVRLRSISQASGPASVMPLNSPSRFQHSMGACRLAFYALAFNGDIADNLLLPVSALLHDAGNPAFSHLSEPFLKEVTGKDGELFLEDILEGSETEKIIRELGLSVWDVVKFVSGRMPPFSKILHGSLDLDNLDNVGRFNRMAGVGAEEYDAIRIALAFKFVYGNWQLSGGVLSEVEKWQEARKAVYNAVYSYPHLDANIMLYRAVELAFSEGELSRDFFLQDDNGAMNYLLKRCNKRTVELVDRFARWRWHEEILSDEVFAPSPKLKELSSSWKGGKFLADYICERLGLSPEKICVYIGKGRDTRRIDLPFSGLSSEQTAGVYSEAAPIYRLKVFVAPECQLGRRKVIEIVHKVVGD